MNATTLMKAAEKAGAEVGAFLAGLRGSLPALSVSINRAAIAYTNRLPLNDIELEKKIEAAYAAAARAAAGLS
jgi:hypothetical protein